jgi:hypothetical protein
VIGPFAARRSARVHRALLVALVASSLGCAIVATATAWGREPLVSCAAAAAAAVAAIAMAGTRQWRFAPRPRRRDAAIVLVSAVSVVLAYPSLGLRGEAWSLAILGGALATCASVAWPSARLAETARPGAGLRQPEDARLR